MELRLFCLLFVISVTSAITVTTDYGDVIGRTVTVNTGVKVDYYYAIPYAKPPVGQLRFRVSFYYNYNYYYYYYYCYDYFTPYAKPSIVELGLSVCAYLTLEVRFKNSN